jgi:NADH-quinone oxidoreductase subunit F
MPEKIVLKNADVPGIADIAVYIQHGGYEGLSQALKQYTPDQITDMVKRSGLRGRGGAGFPTGTKWGFIPKSITPRYLVCNADEGEPGTFKDRDIMEKLPHELVEGVAIAGYAIGANLAFIYLRGEYEAARQSLSKALAQARENGLLGKNIQGSGYDLDIILHPGAGSYECGEETALLESLEGKRGMPRLKPPYPATNGLYDKPTIINNVETLANVPHIVVHGPDWFAAIGTPKSTGTRIFSVSGHVNKPGNYELPMGTPLRTLLYDYAGGIRQGRAVKAVIPGGSSTPVMTGDQLDTLLDFESLAAAGSSLGSAAVIVMDETTCIVRSTLRLAHFYAHESCGKCTPCRQGTYFLEQVLQRIEDGRGKEGDIELLLDVADNMMGKSFCPFADYPGATGPVVSSIKRFRSEYEQHIREHACPFGH